MNIQHTTCRFFYVATNRFSPLFGLFLARYQKRWYQSCERL